MRRLHPTASTQTLRHSLMLKLCLTAVAAQSLLACVDTAGTATPAEPEIRNENSEPQRPLPPPISSGGEAEGSSQELAGSEESAGGIGKLCASSDDCESGVCYVAPENETGICTEVCDEEGISCDGGLTCQYTDEAALLCLPPEPNSPILGEPEPTSCEVSPNRNFIYTVDDSLTIHTVNPETSEVLNRGKCEYNEIYESVISYLNSEGYETEAAQLEWGSLFSQRFFINSLAVTSEGRGFISFSVQSYTDSVYGLIEVPNANAVVDCTTTVLGLEEREHLVFTVGVARDSDGARQERLYGNLIYGQEVRKMDREPGDPHYEERLPRVLMEINLDDLSDTYPLMTHLGIKVSELTQGQNGELLSLYVEDDCHGDCRPPEVGQPEPSGVDVKNFRILEINTDDETLSQTINVSLEAPYNIQCGRNLYGCEYHVGHNLAFFNNNPYVMYTTSFGVDLYHDSVSEIQYNPGHNPSSNTTLHKLAFNANTQTYEEASAIQLDFAILGAASASCVPE